MENNMLNELAHAINKQALSKGFHSDGENIGETLCLIHSEVSEALEADRSEHFSDIVAFEKRFHEIIQSQPNPTQESNDKVFFKLFEIRIKNSFEDELIDIIMRAMALAARKNIDIDKHLFYKKYYNSLRPEKHGKKY